MSNSQRVLTRIGAWIAGGMHVTWTNHQPASDLVQWKRNSARNVVPPAPMGPNVQMVCYELPFWGAYHAGVWTQAELWDVVDRFDNVGHGAAAAIVGELTSYWSFTHTLGNPAINCTRPGDIVMFNGVGHVCIATGNPITPNEVFSVWGMNPIGLQANTPIERTSVTAILAQIAIGAPGLAQTVTYCRPNW